jgi:hypothetical protein
METSVIRSDPRRVTIIHLQSWMSHELVRLISTE